MTAHCGKNVLDKWMLMRELMGDAEISPAALKLAFWLLDHLNGRTGRCDPGRRTLMRETGLARSSIKRARRELSRRGIFTITVRGGTRGRTNRYEPNWRWRRPHQAADKPAAGANAEPRAGGMYDPLPGSDAAPKNSESNTES